MRDRPLKLPRSTPYRSLVLIFGLVALTVLLLVLDRAGRLDALRGQAEVVLNPALAGLSRAGEQVSALGQQLSTTDQLRQQVRELEAENSRLKAENIQAQAQAQENERLRQQVRLEREQPWKLVGAGVLAFSPDAGRNLLRLGVGSSQGIQPGMAVVAQEGSSPPALIGVVEAVQPQSASVLLITDFSSAVSAQIYHQKQSFSGILQGQWQRGSRLRLEQIDRTAQIAPGDVVVTAGLTARLAPALPSAAIPQNVPIGTIETLRVEGNAQQADVRPFIDPGQVHYAWVILSAGG